MYKSLSNHVGEHDHQFLHKLARDAVIKTKKKLFY